MKLNACEMKPVASIAPWATKEQQKNRISVNHYHDKLMGCFLGKNIGGTAGAPLEWIRQVNDFQFYMQELDGNPVPNDDLDIQLLWLIALEERGLDLDAKTLGEYWLTFVTPHWSEYGIGKINMRSGLPAPLCGTHYNEYKDSCGAYIRSEIWAAIAPGAPQIAAKYAYEDAILDHGDGEGTYAEIFTAAMQSAAFLENDMQKLVEIGLSYIPTECATAKAVRFVIDAHAKGMDYLELRDKVLGNFRGCVSGAIPDTASEDDRKKGLLDGNLGFDVPSNIAIVIIGMLYCEDDFEKLMRYTINCGEDTDCTAATAGAIFGIIHGQSKIPQKWLEPIGSTIKTGCLNLGELGGYGAEIPATIENLVERVSKIGKQVSLAYESAAELVDENQEPLAGAEMRCEDASVFEEMAKGPIYSFDFFDIQVVYEGGPAMRSNEEKKLVLRIVNRYKHVEALDIKVWCEDDLTVLPGKSGRMLIKAPYFRGPLFRGNMECAEFTLICEDITQPAVKGVFQITSPGRHTNMCVPFTLVNANLQTYNTDFYYRF